MKNIVILPAIILAIFFAGCDDDDVNSNEVGSIRIEFDNRAGEADLAFNTDYTNSSGETFNVTKLNYYISNIRLTKTDGTEFVVPRDSSYFLVMEADEESQLVTLNQVPAGDYNAITCTIGGDSLRSTMDISKRTGALDPAQGDEGMYWTWNSGYIFFKIEGTSSAAPVEQENKFYYHIGGYGGYDSPTLNNIRETTVSMNGARAEVREGRSPQVHLHVDVLQLFSNPTSIKIADHHSVMLSDFSTTISANYVNMFSFQHVHN